MDETELSFIRCPNCRSLVPAVASRCRMCGFILKDASTKQSTNNSDSSRDNTGESFDGSQDGGEERPSRVRQRTISVSGNSNFTSSVAEVKPEPAPAPVVKPVVPPPPPPPAPAPQASPSISANSEQIVTEDFDESFEDDFEEDEDESESGVTPPSNGEVTAAPGSELVRKKRRRRRRKKKPLGQGIEPVSPQPSVSEVRQEPVVVSAPAPAPEPAPQVQTAINSQPAEEGIAPWRTPPAVESRPGFKIDKPIEQPVTTQVEARERVETRRPEEPRQAPVSGSLVGWLVSYVEDKKGISHEVRDGRFFVGRDRLRPSDFVIDHSTVSTPQCLVVCDSVSGVTIQDLMSEQGTTVIRGSSAIEKSSEQVRLENGDRIRFGEYEMLFIKLPQGR